MNAAADVCCPPGVETRAPDACVRPNDGRGCVAHEAQGRWIVIEAGVVIWLNIEVVTICGRANDRVVEDAEGRRHHCQVLWRNRLGVVDKPGASGPTPAQIVFDGRGRGHARAGNQLADCNRAGSHGADSEHPVTLRHSLRRNRAF